MKYGDVTKIRANTNWDNLYFNYKKSLKYRESYGKIRNASWLTRIDFKFLFNALIPGSIDIMFPFHFLLNYHLCTRVVAVHLVFSSSIAYPVLFYLQRQLNYVGKTPQKRERFAIRQANHEAYKCCV